MNTPKLHIITFVRIVSLLCVLCIYSSVEATNIRFQDGEKQDTLSTPAIHTLWKTANALYNTNAFQKLSNYLNSHINNVNPKTERDSLDIADLYYYQFEVTYKEKKYLESVNSIQKGLPFCATNTSKRGIHIKGALYYKKAYGESSLNFAKRAQNSMKTAIEFLSSDYNPNLDYLVDAYVFLSSEAAYYGNLTDAKRYIRLAKNVYANHREFLDKKRLDRYEIVLAYREAYLLYKRAKTKEDSLQLTNVVQKLNELQASPKFNKHERIYYSTAMNHVGDWYISHKADSLTDEKDLELGNYYLDKSIDLIENKNYPGNLFVFKYNKCKALTKGNQLQKAEKLIIDLLNSMSVTDGRKPFFLAQKALIKAKLKQKDSALHIFHSVIENVHSDTTKLAKNYSNFKPSKSYGHARLLRRVAEKLEEFYNDDPEVKKTISKLYHLAFLQFENSYAKTKFNPVQNELLRNILYGFLNTKKEDSDAKNMSINELLSSTETMMNQMTWQRFYQNRYTNNLPALDSLKYRHLTLRTLLTSAKRGENIRAQDSIQELINKHVTFTNKKFPKLELLSEKKFQISDLQKNLSADELVVKYIIFDKKIAVFSITANDIHYELRSWKQSEIALTENLITTIKNRKYDKNAATLLGKTILPTIADHIKKIIINPDGELYKIPFEVLRTKDQFLTETYEVSYTSNLKFIHLEDDKEKRKAATLSIYAPTYEGNSTALATRSASTSLEGAKAEAEIIGKLFPSNIYIGKKVSKKYFIETSSNASILHLAMHAEINNKEAGLSKLLFSKNNTATDDLYLEELYALNLSADLAVLSACNTGLGKENAGRSMESFQRAFTFAGVPATVASLWEVPDRSTSEIMENFYRHLQKGVSKSKALQNAKLDYVHTHKGSKLAQPYYWAGFILYGDQTAVTTQASDMIWYLLGIGIVCLFLLFFVRKLKDST
ncbi:CHAT domain-containing protein [Kordia sp.]|uniref:CHAT domain-containing protein n=1 Tax=Kordia sp. TaxID=1965332 RepID=UPI003D2D3C7E